MKIYKHAKSVYEREKKYKFVIELCDAPLREEDSNTSSSFLIISVMNLICDGQWRWKKSDWVFKCY